MNNEKVSHTFIRREILALEKQGFEIQRLALRGWDEKLIDLDDIAEQKKTAYVLRNGALSLLLSSLVSLWSSTLWIGASSFLLLRHE